MRNLDYKETYQKLLTPEIVSCLARIHEQKGQQNLFIEAHKDALSELLEIARIQSTEASNRIEGIITTDDRLKKIVRNKTTPRNRNEREIAGYRDVLRTIHEDYDYIPVRPGTILQLPFKFLWLLFQKQFLFCLVFVDLCNISDYFIIPLFILK